MSPSTSELDVDLLILGGGITGAGIARDAALRGLNVALVESHDFASGTSHLTSKVVHGGLRYLEHGHVRPVVEALIERYRLLENLAPNLIRPLQFVLPFENRDFIKWLYVVTGLQLYGLPEWYRCGRAPSPMLGVRLRRDYPLMRPYSFAVTFWDAQTNDSRLVISTLRTAEAHGAVLLNYTAIREAAFDGGEWRVRVASQVDGAVRLIRAKAVANATGPWCPITAEALGVSYVALSWVKGAHIMLPLPPRFGEDAIVLRSVRDERPLWAIPWHHRLIVGTTECTYTGDLRNVRPTPDEVADLFDSFTRAFPRAGYSRDAIKCAYAGVRPIVPQSDRDTNRLSREHRIDADAERRLVTVMGGKLTTFRIMAEQAVDEVERLLGRPPTLWRARRRLRGQQLWPGLSREEGRQVRANLARVYDALPHRDWLIKHLVRLYGWEASGILEKIARQPKLGTPLTESVPYTPAELGYLARTEKPLHLIDLLKRRTSLYFLAENCCVEQLPLIAEYVGRRLDWDAERQAREIDAALAEFDADMAACRTGARPCVGPNLQIVVA
jgi:glycerol-3-phosphate dehydrogenase